MKYEDMYKYCIPQQFIKNKSSYKSYVNNYKYLTRYMHDCFISKLYTNVDNNLYTYHRYTKKKSSIFHLVFNFM